LLLVNNCEIVIYSDFNVEKDKILIIELNVTKISIYNTLVFLTQSCPQ